MPVPSIMIVFRLTMVGTLNGWVVCETNFIMIVGPMAHDLSDLAGRAVQQLLERLGDQRLAAIGAVVGADDQLVGDRAHLVFPEEQLLVARADDRDDMVAGLPSDRARWGTSARCPRRPPRRPPCRSSRSRWGGPAARPRSKSHRPTSIVPICMVDLPTSWKISVIVPAAGSWSAMVSGMRSPCSSAMTMTNCPALALRATCGASTTISLVTSLRTCFSRILYMSGLINPILFT